MFMWNVCWFFPGGQYLPHSLLSVNLPWQYSQGWSYYFLLLGQYQAILFKWFSLGYLYIYSSSDSLFIPFCGIVFSFSVSLALSGPSSASKVKIRTLAIPKDLSILCYIRQKTKCGAIHMYSFLHFLSPLPIKKDESLHNNPEAIFRVSSSEFLRVFEFLVAFEFCFIIILCPPC